jgi:HlyD family secretion protein
MNANSTNRWHLRRFLVVGYLALFILVGGLGGWAAATRIAGAVIAPGALEVEGNRQVIQHPTGGVIEEINARDGDEVTEGDVIIRLDGQSLFSELGIVEGQWFEILARKSRLSAERDGLTEIEFDPELVSRAADSPEIAKLMSAQSQQFEARRKLQSEERQQLLERQTQISRQIEGLEALQSATQSQIDLLSREISGQEELLRQGLTQVTRVLTPQRELARLQGTDGQVEATIAENRGKIAEIEIERVRLDSELRETAISELRDLEFREIELRERRQDLLDRIEKLDLRAPVSGIVYGSTADTLRGVIRPAEPVMYIVPKDIPLIVRSRIEPIHIDQVYVGQEANLRFSAFDARTTPEVTGHVKSISADTYEDPNLRLRYYKVEIQVDADMREKLGDDLVLLPGMPVEAFIRTADRSPLSFIIRPFATYFNRAFREG